MVQTDARWFETGQKDLGTADKEYLVKELRGGEAIIIKALVGNSGNIYVGRKGLDSNIGFELSPGESLRVEYLPEKAVTTHIEIYALASEAGDDLCWIIVP